MACERSSGYPARMKDRRSMLNYAPQALMAALVAVGLAVAVVSDSDRIRPGSIVTIDGEPEQMKVISRHKTTGCWQLMPMRHESIYTNDCPTILAEPHRIDAVVGFKAVRE